MINLIKDTASLEAFCAQLQNQPYITIDLEFIRRKNLLCRTCIDSGRVRSGMRYYRSAGRRI